MDAVASNCHVHWKVNVPAALDGRDPEGIHQSRVGLRRLRSALPLFKKHIPSEQRAWIKQEATWLLAQMSAARDLDVFIQDLSAQIKEHPSEKAVLTQLLSAAKRRRQTAYSTAAQALGSTRANRFSNRLEAWIGGRGWRPLGSKRASEKKSKSARVFAQRRLNRRMKEMRATYKDIGKLTTEDRHALRIDVKKLRYGLIFFSFILPKKRAQRFMATLKNLQDNLGHLNDLAVAERTIENILSATNDKRQRAQIEIAREAILHRHSEAAARVEPETAKLWRKFRKIQRF